MTARAQAFTFTVNNYTGEDIEALSSIDCAYIVYGKEVGDSGTPHLQGYIRFKTQRTLSSVSKKIKRAHLELARNCVAAAEYCKKDGDVYERGVPPMQKKEQAAAAGEGAKRKFEEIRDLAIAGKLDDIAKDYPGVWLQRYSTLKKIKMDHMKAPEWLESTCGTWIVGPAGCGKTTKAREMCPDAYWKESDTHWWDGYQGEDDVVIDDFDKYMVKQAYHLKRWADRQPFNAETKGGSAIIRPKRVVVTSQYAIEDIWVDDPTRDALNRRFEIIDCREEKPWHYSYNT